jgi:hypothetical protein
VLVLSSTSRKSKDYVASIEAICWDISEGEGDVWPALAFKKSPLGDLDDFLTQELGKKLDVRTRINLAMMIAEGYDELHFARKIVPILFHLYGLF